MAVTDEINDRLQAAFAPRELQVADVSESHRGHAGWREGVRIRADAFAGAGRLAQHRAVHRALGADLLARIHALSLDVGA